MLFVLADFSVIKPDVGLILWTTIFFAIFWFLIGRFAFKPIAEALKSREDSIQDALDEAKKAREEMSKLKSENDALLAKANEERAAILKEAKDMKNSIITEAKDKAKEEAQKIVNNARADIDSQKNAAIAELKGQVGTMALDIAEKILRKELKNDKEQISFANKVADEMNLN